MSKICYLSDFDFGGSGYQKIGVQICQGLQEQGNMVKAVGLFYRNQPHKYDFSIFPAQNMHEAMGTIQNLFNIYKFDAFIVALDINLQVKLLRDFNSRPFKYIGIAPIESDPLIPSWAMWLNSMDKFYAISEFGKNEAVKAGVIGAEWLPIGLDMDVWKTPTDDFRKGVRKAFGFDDNTFVVLTVADNQERKNLSGCLKAYKLFVEANPNIKTKYVIVTKADSPVGWNLDDLKREYGIADKVMVVDRGMDEESLYGWYCTADCHLLLSKAEGLGLPTMEAMISGVSAIGTDCTATRDLLKNDRGYLIPYVLPPDKEPYRDPFGNGNRYFANLCDAAYVLEYIYKNQSSDEVKAIRQAGIDYIKSINTKQSAILIDTWIKENVTKKD